MIEEIRLFSAFVTAIVLEAAPFLLVGSLISAIFEVYFSQDKLKQYCPTGTIPGVLLGLVAGMAIPTCECGVVPITRRLLKKGVPAHIGITYMLSAPVINPVVLISTYIAFNSSPSMVLGRVVLVAVPAIFIGLTVSRLDPQLLVRPEKDKHKGHHDGHNHDHEHCHDHCCDHHHGTDSNSRPVQVLLHTASEFIEMGKYLILGAMVAGLFKTFLPQHIMAYFEQNIFLAIGAMMLLAILLSICSEADAFVAASFTSFPKAAQLSFVAIGPMVDLKLIFMYFAVFNKRLAWLLIIIPTFLIYLLSVNGAFLFGFEL